MAPGCVSKGRSTIDEGMVENQVRSLVDGDRGSQRSRRVDNLKPDSEKESSDSEFEYICSCSLAGSSLLEFNYRKSALGVVAALELASKFHRGQDDIRSYEEGTTENAKHRKTDILLRKYALEVVKELEVKLSRNKNDPIVLAYQELVPGPTVAGYMESFKSSLFDVNEVELHGTLRGLGDGNKPLTR